MTDGAPDWFENVIRTGDFWRRAISIYASYKGTQAKAFVLSHVLGKSEKEVTAEVWKPQHEQAGKDMYELCVTLRGFYLKAGQFIGSRTDFVPEQVCRKLTLLCDKVPPMPEAQAREAVMRELGCRDLGEVFEWIDLAKPLGSASISQVHKAKLRTFSPSQLRAARRPSAADRHKNHTVAGGQSAWDVCNLYGVGLSELAHLNPGVTLDELSAGTTLKVPTPLSLATFSTPSSSSSTHSSTSSSSGSGSSSSASSSSGSIASGNGAWKAKGGEGTDGAAAAAVLNAVASGSAPANGLVAVKIQYPDAQPKMLLDLQNLRVLAFYLSRTELKFDLLSAVDELNKQIRLEFDFVREARVMDTIAHHLRHVSDRIRVPRSVPGLANKRLLVMHYLEGIPLTEAGSRIKDLSEIKRRLAKRRILTRVSEAYGRMIFGEGLFQADGHPGNILVSKGGRIGLLDYGQSKQLPEEQRHALARLVLEMDRGDPERISAALGACGVVTEKQDPGLRTEMAYGMFDTRGKVDPFDPKSPIKQSAISSFPPDLFFVMRVVQLLRGMSTGMGVTDFSCASQWAPLARAALHRHSTNGHSRQARCGGWAHPLTSGALAISRLALSPLHWVGMAVRPGGRGTGVRPVPESQPGV